jgi:hypothetical protein
MLKSVDDKADCPAKRGDLYLLACGTRKNTKLKFCLVSSVARDGYARELRTPNTANTCETIKREPSEVFAGYIISQDRFPAGTGAEQILRALPREFEQHEWLKEYDSAEQAKRDLVAVIEAQAVPTARAA